MHCPLLCPAFSVSQVCEFDACNPLNEVLTPATAWPFLSLTSNFRVTGWESQSISIVPKFGWPNKSPHLKHPRHENQGKHSYPKIFRRKSLPYTQDLYLQFWPLTLIVDGVNHATNLTKKCKKGGTTPSTDWVTPLEVTSYRG